LGLEHFQEKHARGSIGGVDTGFSVRRCNKRKNGGAVSVSGQCETARGAHLIRS
jgi:hypothetical protein